jgi:Uncharacterised nucleotidyltransferase
MEFLHACIQGDRHRALTALHQNGWSWDALFAAASAEALLPSLSGFLREMDLAEGLGVPITGFLAAVECSNRERNERITGELKSAVALLNQVGIEPVVLKGLAYLATGVYKDTGARYLIDIDLLLAEDEVGAASGILARNGFVVDGQDPFRDFRHHLAPLRRPGSVWIELHHCLGLGRCKELLPASEVIARSVPYDLDGLKVRVPCPEHLLVHLIMHSQIRHPYNERIWPPLRAVADLVLLTRRFGPELPWDAIVNRFSASGYYRLLVLHLLDVKKFVGMEFPCELRIDLLTLLCWERRQTLRRWSTLRYLDPVYMFSTLLSRRLAMLRKLLLTRNGIRHLFSQILVPRNYARIWTDLIEGRGR